MAARRFRFFIPGDSFGARDSFSLLSLGLLPRPIPGGALAKSSCLLPFDALSVVIGGFILSFFFISNLWIRFLSANSAFVQTDRQIEWERVNIRNRNLTCFLFIFSDKILHWIPTIGEMRRNLS